MVGGEPAEGLRVLDEMIDRKVDDEHSLSFGLLALYEAFEDRHPIETVESDRARRTRLADVYRSRERRVQRERRSSPQRQRS
jgi:hypothetical protein